MRSGFVSPPSRTAPNIIISPRAKKLYRDPADPHPIGTAAAKEGEGSYSSVDDTRYQQQQQYSSSGSRAPVVRSAPSTLPIQSGSNNQLLNLLMQQQQQQPNNSFDNSDDHNKSNPQLKSNHDYNDSNNNNRNNHNGSPLNLPPPLLTSNNHNLSHEELLQKLAYVEGRLKASLQDTKSETDERKRIALKNIELTKQLAQSKKGLQEMQLLLKSIKESTDDMSRKRDQRDRELVRVMQENKDLLFKSNKSDATNRELLDTCRELQSKYEDSQKSAESMSQKEHRKYQKEIRALKEQIRDREEDVRRAQADFTESQENYSRLRSDLLRLHGERTITQAELETVKSQCVTLEGSYTKIQAELYELRREKTTIFNEYKQEIDRMRRITHKDQLGDGSFLSSYAEDAMATDSARRSFDGRFGTPGGAFAAMGSPQSQMVSVGMASPPTGITQQFQPFAANATASPQAQSDGIAKRSLLASTESIASSAVDSTKNALWDKVKTLVPERQADPAFISFTKGLVDQQKAKKKKLEGDLKEWNRMFITINGRAATKEEQSTQAKQIVDQIKEISSEVKRTRATIVSGVSNKGEVAAPAAEPVAADAAAEVPIIKSGSKWGMLKK